VNRVLTDRFKDRALVEYEVADKVITHFEGWAKIAGWVIGGAGALLAVAVTLLGLFGIKSYSDATSNLDRASKMAINRVSEQADSSATALKTTAASYADQLDKQKEAIAGALRNSGNPEQIQSQVQNLNARVRQLGAQLTTQEQMAKENEQKLSQLRSIASANPTVQIGQLDQHLLTPSWNSSPVLAVSEVQALGPGSKGEIVTRIQNRLKELGCYEVEPTGVFDDATTAAVQLFKRTSMLYIPDSLRASTVLMDYSTATDLASPFLVGIHNQSCHDLKK
jgi:hypothetical protein